MADRPRFSPRLLGVGVLLLAVVIAAAAWFAFDQGFRSEPPPSALAGHEAEDEFERRIRAYLLDNPEVILEAMQRLQARQRAAEASEAQAAVRARADELFHDPDSPVGGNPDGDVTMVEFSDYNCPYCRRVAPVMIEAEAADPELRIVYKEFPILGPNSVFASKAALAAHRQGMYVTLHKALMQLSGVADEASVLAVAEQIGLDLDRLKEDMDDPAIQSAIDRNLALAGALRITGTPTFVIGEQTFRGATDLATLQTLIRQARTAQRSER